jgi:hypothetical protein
MQVVKAVTFKDLRTGFSLEATSQQTKLFERRCHKPFWIWDQQQHRLRDIAAKGACCFNHVIGFTYT